VRTFWDTSAAINAAVSTGVYRRLLTGDHVARLHLLAEFFATMTGRGVEVTDDLGNTRRVFLTPNECAAWPRDFAEKVHFEELDAIQVRVAGRKVRITVLPVEPLEFSALSSNPPIESLRDFQPKMACVASTATRLWNKAQEGRRAALRAAPPPALPRCQLCPHPTPFYFPATRATARMRLESGRVWWSFPA